MDGPQTKATPRPKALPVKPDAIPQSLRDIPQWVLWKFTWVGGKWTKPPYDAKTGRHADTTEPATWTDFATALSIYQSGGWDGIGLVLTEELGIVGIDLDKCRDPQTGELEPSAQKIIDGVGSYAEDSPSGRGVHIIAMGAKPPGRCRKDRVEMYSTKRYLTITGHHLAGSPERVHECSEALARLHRELFPDATAKPAAQPPTVARDDDDEILKKAKAAKNGDKFSRLWAGDASGYASHSEADLALCSLVAFWTQDAGQIDRLFRRSGLMRDKWDREDYRTMTTSKAIQGAAQRKSDDQHRGEGPQAQQLVRLTLDADAELFHDPNRVAYASVSVGDHTETHRVRSRDFSLWLRALFFQKNAKPPGAQALQDALGVLEAKALFEGGQHPVHVRVAGAGDAIYIDLCNPGWQVIEIDADGWQVLDHAPVKFRRAKAMLPLPAPERSVSIDLLRKHVNVRDEDWPLLVGWIAAALRPNGPYPVLGLFGEQGSAKSTTSRVCRALIDPNTAPVRAEPREPRDLAVAANNGWVVALDNASHLPAWLSDAYCRLSTGGGFSTRTLYENEDETIFDAQRPVVINAIEEVATRGDLLDRAVLITCPPIPDQERQTETEFWRRFDCDRARILGALLAAVSVGLGNLRKVELDWLPRMADFARWVAACAPALGFTAKQFRASYDHNRDAANDAALESSPIVKHVMSWLDRIKTDWTGTTSEMLDALKANAAQEARNVGESDGWPKSRSWPQTPKALSNVLRRLAPNLRKAGVEIEFPDKNPRGGVGRVLTIRKREGEDRSDRSDRSPSEKTRGKRRYDANDRSEDRSDDRSVENPTKTSGSDGRYGRYDDSPHSSNGRGRAEPSLNGEAQD